jgi:aminopeptidase N
MSSYLVALIVSDFVCISDNANAGLTGNLPIGSCGRPNAKSQLNFGLDVAVKSMEYFQNLYQLEFPLPKCGNFKII